MFLLLHEGNGDAQNMSKIAGYDTHDDGPGFVGIRFCQECNNMLYPKEDKENKVLMYAVSIKVYVICFSFVQTMTFSILPIFSSAETAISNNLLTAIAFT